MKLSRLTQQNNTHHSDTKQNDTQQNEQNIGQFLSYSTDCHLTKCCSDQCRGAAATG